LRFVITFIGSSPKAIEYGFPYLPLVFFQQRIIIEFMEEGREIIEEDEGYHYDHMGMPTEAPLLQHNFKGQRFVILFDNEGVFYV